jgi:hypothetical protein
MTSEAGRSFSGAPEPSYSESTGGKGPQQSAMNSARESIAGAATEVGAKVAAGINTQRTKAAEGLGSVAQALRQSGETLRSKNPETIVPQYISSAADQVERLSGYLRANSVSQMVTGLEQFARSQPALFIGSAFMLGLLGARFLKSSGHSQRGSNEGAEPAQYASSRRTRTSVDPRTSAGYWREQEAREGMDRSDLGGSRMGEEPF